MENDLDQKFKRLSDLLWNALHEREFNEQYPDARPLPRYSQKALDEEGAALMEEILSADQETIARIVGRSHASWLVSPERKTRPRFRSLPKKTRRLLYEGKQRVEVRDRQ